jgi:hypothetical protein
MTDARNIPYRTWSFVVSFMPIDFFLFWICNIPGLVYLQYA